MLSAKLSIVISKKAAGMLELSASRGIKGLKAFKTTFAGKSSSRNGALQ